MSKHLLTFPAQPLGFPGRALTPTALSAVPGRGCLPAPSPPAEPCQEGQSRKASGGQACCFFGKGCRSRLPQASPLLLRWSLSSPVSISGFHPALYSTDRERRGAVAVTRDPGAAVPVAVPLGGFCSPGAWREMFSRGSVPQFFTTNYWRVR